MKEILDAWSFASSSNENQHQFIVLIYNCDTSQRNFIRLDEEVSEFKFVPILEIENLDMRQEYKDSIKKNTFRIWRFMIL